MLLDDVISQLKTLAHLEAVEGMHRFTINTDNALGVSLPELRRFAKKIGKNHNLAVQLWNTGIREARLLATLVDEPDKVTERQMDRWAHDFDSWDICDQCCGNLFDRTPWAYQKAVEWAGKEEEMVKRAGFVLMAELAVHDKKTGDEEFIGLLGIIQRGANDDRNFVKKAVNWALRQIGKRNRFLNHEAVRVAEQLLLSESKTAKWIAADALRELTAEKLRSRFPVESN